MKRFLRRLLGRPRPGPAWPRLDAETERFALRLPKVDLHVPLEATLRPATVLALAARAGTDLGVDSEAELRGVLVPRDPAGWRTVRRRLRRLLADPRGLAQALGDLVAEMAIQEILYAEVVVPLGALLAGGLSAEGVREILGETRQGARGRGVELAFLLGLDGGDPEDERVAALAAGDLGWAGVVLESREDDAPVDLSALGAAGDRLVLVGAAKGGAGVPGRTAVRGARRIVHWEGGQEGPVRVRCPAVDRLLRVPSGDHGPVATAGGPLMATNLTREMLRAAAGLEDPRAAMVASVRAGIEAAFVDDDRRAAWSRRLEDRLEQSTMTLRVTPIDEEHGQSPSS